MVLVDTSVWVNFLRTGEPLLSQLLEQSRVYMHPMVLGELACGNLHQRSRLLTLWNNLPSAIEASHTEALNCLESNKLMGCGIGYVDLHLLASTALSHKALLWSHDRRLQRIADKLSIGQVFS